MDVTYAEGATVREQIVSLLAEAAHLLHHELAPEGRTREVQRALWQLAAELNRIEGKVEGLCLGCGTQPDDYGDCACRFDGE
jgi:hypothetical protein